jgi:hypothetical protein
MIYGLIIAIFIQLLRVDAPHNQSPTVKSYTKRQLQSAHWTPHHLHCVTTQASPQRNQRP